MLYVIWPRLFDTPIIMENERPQASYFVFGKDHSLLYPSEKRFCHTEGLRLGLDDIYTAVLLGLSLLG